MRTTQGNTLQSLHDVQQFLSEHAAQLSEIADSGARRHLDETITMLASDLTDQSGGDIVMRGATRTQHALRRALVRDHLAPIVKIARVEQDAVPALASFRLPRNNPTAAKLAAIAYGMADSVAPHASRFIGAGLRDDFIVRLTRATDALLAAIEERAQNRGRWHGGTQGLKTRLTTGRKLVHILDTLVRSALAEDPSLLAHWNSIKRVRRVSTRASAAAEAIAAMVATVNMPSERRTTPLSFGPASWTHALRSFRRLRRA